MSRALLLSVLLVSGSLGAQDQMMVRVNNAGILSIMESALEYNQRGQGRKGFQVPAGLYDFKIKRQDLQANPIVRILQEVSEVDLDRDFPFHLYNSVVNVKGGMDKSSLRTAITNYTSSGFDLRISFAIDQLRLSADELSICEDRNGKNCGEGLKATFKNNVISLQKGSKIKTEALFKVDLTSTQAKIKLIKVSSNLNATIAPKIDISVGEVIVPQISIIINGQEAQLDTSNLRDELMGRRDFLASKLLEFSAEFIAEDLAEMMNKALGTKCLPTQLRLIEIGMQDVPARRGGYQPQSYVVAVEKNETSTSQTQAFSGDNQPAPTFMELLQRDLAQIIKSARLDLKLKSIRSPLDQDIELRADGAFELNNRRWNVLSSIANSSRQLPPLDVDTIVDRQDHFSVAIGEPVVNASLDLLQSMGVFQKALEAQGKIGGVSVNSLKVHFKSGRTTAEDRLFVIGNLRVNLREIDANGIMGWVKRTIAVWLERNNNNSILNFPVQFEITPRFVSQKDGSVKFYLRVNSPFVNPTTLRNDYLYPNNVVRATELVRESIIEILRSNMGGNVDREFEVPLDEYLDLNGVTLEPKRISMIKSGYLMVSANIKKLDFERMTKTESGASCQ